MVVLTEKTALKRARVKSLSSIVRLNLWNMQLTDLSILQNMPNLEVLTVSANSANTLKDLVSCTKLKELYMRNNTVESLRELQHIRGLLCLRVLWLSDNPCADDSDYRMHAIQTLPQLQVLDGVDIEDEERLDASTAALSDSRQRSLSISAGADATSTDQTDSGRPRIELPTALATQLASTNPVLAAVVTLLDTLGPEALQSVVVMAQDRITRTTRIGSSSSTTSEGPAVAATSNLSPIMESSGKKSAVLDSEEQ